MHEMIRKIASYGLVPVIKIDSWRSRAALRRVEGGRTSRGGDYLPDAGGRGIHPPRKIRIP
jgi:hypothetical protein